MGLTRSFEMTIPSESVHKIHFPPAREISPLIRTARWGLFAMGITYGYLRYRYLCYVEPDRYLAYKARLKERGERYVRAFKRRERRENANLAKECDVVPKEQPTE